MPPSTSCGRGGRHPTTRVQLLHIARGLAQENFPLHGAPDDLTSRGPGRVSCGQSFPMMVCFGSLPCTETGRNLLSRPAKGESPAALRLRRGSRHALFLLQKCGSTSPGSQGTRSKVQPMPTSVRLHLLRSQAWPGSPHGPLGDPLYTSPVGLKAPPFSQKAPDQPARTNRCTAAFPPPRPLDMPEGHPSSSCPPLSYSSQGSSFPRGGAGGICPAEPRCTLW